MIKHSLTHTLKDKQKHNQNNNRQKYVGDDVTKRKIPDMSLIKILGNRYLNSTPKNINQCYY